MKIVRVTFNLYAVTNHIASFTTQRQRRRPLHQLRSGESDLAQALLRAGQSRNPLDNLTSNLKEPPKWYESMDKLPFECTECGACCKTKGEVYLNPAETKSAASMLNLTVDEFKVQFVSREEEFPTDRDVVGWTVLKQRQVGDTTECVFLKDNKCGIYGARPLQCSTYPFWPRFMDNVEGWNGEVVEEDGDKKWSFEEGGCEGMKRINESEEREQVGNGASIHEATEKLEMYKRYKKRFPLSDFTGVQNKT